MKKLQLWIAGVACLAAGAAVAVQTARGSGQAARVTPSARAGEVRGLEVAVPFLLDEPWTHAWRAEQPSVHSGWLVVLDVDPTFVHVTELAQPVLCAGVETLERLNHGEESGRVVAILPDGPATDSNPSTALEREPFYFASPALPEALTQRDLQGELTRARARGRVPFGADEIAAACRRGGAPIVAHDRVELDRLAAELLTRYAPEEREKADALRVPLTR